MIAFGFNTALVAGLLAGAFAFFLAGLLVGTALKIWVDDQRDADRRFAGYRPPKDREGL